jgi:hypothetical protein
MKTDLKSVFLRARHTLVEDFTGLAALVAMLVVGLHLPGMI